MLFPVCALLIVVIGLLGRVIPPAVDTFSLLQWMMLYGVQFNLLLAFFNLLPIPPLAMQLRTGIAILSYANHLVFGIIGDYDGTPDVDELASGIERAVTRLTAISTVHWRSTPVGTLALVQGG